MEKLLTGFHAYIKEYSLLRPEDKVLVAVSGGVDSMVLMSLLVSAGYDIGVAHCNFQLRGEEAYEDEVLVEKEAARYGVPFYNIRFDTQGEMDRTGDSVQIAARRLRYDWFAELCRDHGYTVIAIAHHADDSIETFFINLFRGTGLKGLTGISVVNGRVVRPLLFASRKDILDYAHSHSIPFREDSSNCSTKYLRNKIRLGLIPRMREISPEFPRMMGANVQRLTNAQLFINRAVEKIRDTVEMLADGIITLDIEKIDPQFPLNFVVYELMNTYGFKGDVIDSLCTALKQAASGRRFYSKEYVAYTDRNKIILMPISETDTCDVSITREMIRSYCGNSVFYYEHTDIDNIDTLNVPQTVALLDEDLLQYPLRIRRWQEGDWMIPLGMTGRKKISDILVDLKVSMAEKSRQFVVVSGEDIVWLAGRRLDDRYKITSKTENVLRISKEVI